MKPKIVFVASYAQSLLNFRLALMQEFLARNYKVIAMAPFDSDVSAQLAELHIEFIPIAIARNGLNPFADLQLLIHLWQKFCEIKPDLIFAYTIKPIIYGSFAAKLAGVKNIYSMITGTGYIFTDVNWKSKVVGYFAQKLFKFALLCNKHVFFQNKDNSLFFQQKKIISSRKSLSIINGSGVDCTFFTSETYPKDISFLMIARLLYDKGIREYVQVARLIKASYPFVKFQLAGWIDTNPNSITQEQLNDWLKEGNIEYLGKLSDVRPAIENTSVYVLPSYHEGTPRTVLEAMAMSRPIITTDAPGCKETVVPHQNGFLVPIKNIEELYKAMEFFITSPEIIPIMGSKSRKLAVDKYDVNKVNHNILKIMVI